MCCTASVANSSPSNRASATNSCLGRFGKLRPGQHYFCNDLDIENGRLQSTFSHDRNARTDNLMCGQRWFQ